MSLDSEVATRERPFSPDQESLQERFFFYQWTKKSLQERDLCDWTKKSLQERDLCH